MPPSVRQRGKRAKNLTVDASNTRTRTNPRSSLSSSSTHSINQSTNQSSDRAPDERNFFDFYHSLNQAHRSSGPLSRSSDPYSDISDQTPLDTASTLNDQSDSDDDLLDQSFNQTSVVDTSLEPSLDDASIVESVEINPRLKAYLKRWSQLHGKRSDQGQLFFRDLNKLYSDWFAIEARAPPEMFANLKTFADYMVFNGLFSDISRVEYELLIREVEEGGSFMSMVDRVWSDVQYRQSYFDRHDVEEWVRLMIDVRESQTDLTTRQGVKEADVKHSDAFSALIEAVALAQPPAVERRSKRKASSLPAQPDQQQHVAHRAPPRLRRSHEPPTRSPRSHH